MLAIGAGHHGGPAPLVYLLAVITFLGASAGSSLLIHGHHLFEKIRVSERWQRLPPARPEMTPVVPPGQKAVEVSAEILDASQVISDQSDMSEKPRFGAL